MITPEQQKKIFILAGILVVVIAVFVFMFLMPQKGAVGNGPRAAAPSSTPTPATPSAPSTTANPPAAPAAPPSANPPSAPAAGPAGLPPGNNTVRPPLMGRMPGMRSGTKVAGLPKPGVKGQAEPQLVLPPVTIPTMGDPASVNAGYDPFANGPKPPPPPRAPKIKYFYIRPATWINADVRGAYQRHHDLNDAPVTSGEIRLVSMPFMHASTVKPTPWSREPRKEAPVSPPPGRDAGYVYSENGMVYAIFEDGSHNAQAVKVGDKIGEYVVRAITLDAIILRDANQRDYSIKLQSADAASWNNDQNVNIDALGDAPKSAPPRWGYRP